jgi:catechol 2,3-dioxygenase-like lactoylglutathione lyase family enzyme
VNPLKKLLLRLHHQAFATHNQEETRQFMEDVLGIPLVAMVREGVQAEGGAGGGVLPHVLRTARRRADRVFPVRGRGVLRP